MIQTAAALGKDAWNSQMETFSCINELAQNKIEMEKPFIFSGSQMSSFLVHIKVRCSISRNY